MLSGTKNLCFIRVSCGEPDKIVIHQINFQFFKFFRISESSVLTKDLNLLFRLVLWFQEMLYSKHLKNIYIFEPNFV
jgi:hypothetical protein